MARSISAGRRVWASFFLGFFQVLFRLLGVPTRTAAIAVLARLPDCPISPAVSASFSASRGLQSSEPPCKWLYFVLHVAPVDMQAVAFRAGLLFVFDLGGFFHFCAGPLVFSAAQLPSSASRSFFTSRHSSCSRRFESMSNISCRSCQRSAAGLSPVQPDSVDTSTSQSQSGCRCPFVWRGERRRRSLRRPAGLIRRGRMLPDPCPEGLCKTSGQFELTAREFL